MTRWIPCLLTVLLLPLSTAQAQQPDDEDFSVPWRTSQIPYIGSQSNDGPMLMLLVRRWQPSSSFFARTTYTGALEVRAGISTHGSRFLQAEFDAPLLASPWRFKVAGLAGREARFGYYGVGNGTAFDDDLVTEAQPFLYRVARTRYRGYAEVTRAIGAKLSVAAAGAFESSRYAPLPGPSVFRTDFPAGEIEEDDASLRLALVYDTRSIEYDTPRGLLLEAGAQAGTGGSHYSRLYTVLRGYLPLREGTTVAARIGASGMGGGPPLSARLQIPAWNEPVQVLGGPSSHRALDAGRLAGRHLLFSNLELRHDIINLGVYGAVTFLAFVDAGRVFETESFAVTTDEVKVGGGGGLALRILRSTIFTFNLATGPDGRNFSVGNGWMF